MPTKLELLLLEHRVVHGPRAHNGESYLWCLLESIVSHPEGFTCGKQFHIDESVRSFVDLRPFPDIFYEAGFVIKGAVYIIREGWSVDRLIQARDAVGRFFNVETYDYPPDLVRRVNLPPFQHTYTVPFLRDLQFRSHISMAKDDPDLQKAAMEIIKRGEVEKNVQKNFNAMQNRIAEGTWSGKPLPYCSFLLDSLVNWFKECCFQWVDNPKCDHCDGETVMSHMSQDHLLRKYADRVEMHKCSKCDLYTPFPRYNNLYMLLMTRRGRCGEFANVFTLFCRTLGWDARHVFDETDHVWTEVYSEDEKRWIHVDSCETKVDTPLMYESGWNKKLSYVIAYSGEDVQDVTWRYTGNFAEIRKRRLLCSEGDLVRAIVETRALRQRGCSNSRRTILAMRTISELCELMIEKKATESDSEGRTSGSLEWRRMRNEIDSILGGENKNAMIWSLDDGDLFNLTYSAALDKYVVGTTKILQGWKVGVFQSSNIFRKVERDWKMAYLCRSANEKCGEIVWAFEITTPGKVLDYIEAEVSHTSFENGQVEVTISSGTETVAFGSKTKVSTGAFEGLKKFSIKVTLTGGIGENSWQHAQLFRQPLDSAENPFAVKVKLKHSSHSS